MTQQRYRLHMISFQSVGSNGYNVAFGDGGNLQPWHLDMLEEWLAAQRAKQVSVLMAESNKAMENLPWQGDDGSDLV